MRPTVGNKYLFVTPNREVFLGKLASESEYGYVFYEVAWVPYRIDFDEFLKRGVEGLPDAVKMTDPTRKMWVPLTCDCIFEM